MIKKWLFICLISVTCYTSVQALPYTAQTFFMPRALAIDAVQEYALSHARLSHVCYEKEYEQPVERAAFQVQSSILYQESTNKDELAAYFLFDGKQSLVVNQQGSGDIGSGWLGLFAGGNAHSFNGTFSIAPQRSVVAAILNFHADISQALNGVWLSGVLPFIRATHNLNLEESGVSDPVDQGSFQTITAALNNPEWRYGKWSATPLSRTGLDDFLLKAGYGFVQTKRVRFDGFLELVIPLGEKPTSEFVFEPMVGMGGHVGLGGGLKGHADLMKTDRQTFCFVLDLQYRHLFSQKELRSFDIKDKPWSRYLLFNSQNGTLQQILPGINFFTQELSVKPGGRFDLMMAFNYGYSWVHAEVGYRYFWKNDDAVRLVKPWPYEISISAQADNTFLSDAQIGNAWGLPGSGQGDFEAITQDDLDLRSAAHKTAKSHTVYGALSAHIAVARHPGLAGAGFSFEFAERNSSLDQWTVWGSLSIGF